MPVALLYAILVLIWGSTWITIKFQLGVVAEEVSVAYRFALASGCLFVYARAKGHSLALPRSDYLLVAVMGALMFSLSYVLVYIGSGLIATGLVAVLYSLIIIFNGLLERFFLQARRSTAACSSASAVGLSGTALVFWPEVSEASILATRPLLGISAGPLRPCSWRHLATWPRSAIRGMAGPLLSSMRTRWPGGRPPRC